ncbi:MAG: hypothetical protein A3A97_03045 [Candidatus Terrybacteria bacterium RIFCSPLOWO2_01_FULL_40_23]|uniref:Uncharacterized protein n=1 Tax=Candidatus Terrybacteria bacterium RIFCSPLOWO2_01_FULL_40_23 TaxID=1802366 RepID=A0A1G2PU62_9BACT|nr:MAG: hypothetical protein A3A97_03045 [Candidatus Terrybacteria bacterium RIFCSPLOWO2_01_FULL_40_23]
MDTREIRERGQFGSQRNRDKTKIKTKRIEKLFDVSTTKRVKLGERLRPETVDEFRGELSKIQALRKHTSYVYEKDFKDTIMRVNKKIGDKLTPIQERHLRALFFAPESTTRSSGQSSRLARLHADLEDDSPDKPYQPLSSIDDQKESDNPLERLRDQREERQERKDKKEDKKEDKEEPPSNLPIAI